MPIIRVGENDIHYEVEGAGPGLPVVLIMGLAIDMRGWDKQVPALAASRQVIRLDNRGAGRSTKPTAKFTTADMAGDVAAVMDAVGVPVAHIVGVSLGGAIAQEFAINHPERVRSLVLLSTFASGKDMRPAAESGAGATGGMALADMLAAASSGTLQLDPKVVFQFLVPMVFSKEFREREKEQLRGMMERLLSYGFSPSALAGQVGAAMAHDSVPRLASIQVPTLVAHGDKDRLVKNAVSLPLSEKIPGARRLELPGMSHGIPFENADALNELLIGWLAEHDPV